MHPSTSLLVGLTLTLGTAFSAAPASAQQPAVPPATVSALPAPLPPVPDPALLVIPPPPGGKLRVEMDARSDDLLGMVKSFLKGIGETGTPVVMPGAVVPTAPNPVAQAISGGDLAALLKDVNHVHFVVYEVAGPPMPFTMPALPHKPGLKKSAFAAPVTPTAPPLPTFDSNSFYESAFAAEGAHRVLFTDADEYKLVMVGFPDKHGFAFAASGGGYVVVERSDGYPDLEALSAFVSHVTTAVVNSQMGKKVMKSTLSPLLGTAGKEEPGNNTESKK